MHGSLKMERRTFIKSASHLLMGLAFLFFNSLYSQNLDLNQFQWKHRVLIIGHESNDTQFLNKQLELLNKDKVGYEERKLLIIGINEKGYQIYKENSASFINTTKPYKDLKLGASDHTILLIGLDGGIKYRSKDTMTTRQLFSIIDGMPMRQSEIRNK